MFAFKCGDIISYNVSDAICHKPGEVSTRRVVQAEVLNDIIMPDKLEGFETTIRHMEIEYFRTYFSDEKGLYERLNIERIYDLSDVDISGYEPV